MLRVLIGVAVAVGLLAGYVVYDLTRYRRARAAHDNGEPTALDLRGGPGEPAVTLFNAFHYRLPDLRLAADALDEAIRAVNAGAALPGGA